MAKWHPTSARIAELRVFRWAKMSTEPRSNRKPSGCRRRRLASPASAADKPAGPAGKIPDKHRTAEMSSSQTRLSRRRWRKPSVRIQSETSAIPASEASKRRASAFPERPDPDRSNAPQRVKAGFLMKNRICVQIGSSIWTSGHVDGPYESEARSSIRNTRMPTRNQTKSDFRSSGSSLFTSL